MIKFLFQLLLIAFLSLQVIHANGKTGELDLEKLDTYLAQTLETWKVPGMAIAIVKDDEVIFARGYGVKEIGKPVKVDENTMFAIASNTKAFTSACLAILVDEEQISWDDKVVDYLPYFKLYSPYVTQEFTIRDLLCHRSGLATFSGDLLWYGTTHSRKEVISRAQYLQPVFDFRSGYGYQNIMFLAAGEIIPVVTGKSWDDFVKEKFFDPLGMKSTVTSVTELPGRSNVAKPHSGSADKNIPIEYINWDNIAPAGSIISSVSDLAKWIMLQLNLGSLNGKTYFSEYLAHEMWSAHTPKTISKWSRENMPSRHYSAYALGWDTYDYHGSKVVTHGGGYDGMISKTVMIPEENLGFVILTNSNTSLTSCLAYHILDNYFGNNEKDWSAQFLEWKLSSQQRKDDKDLKSLMARRQSTSPSLPLINYTGTYGGEMYGNAEISVIADELVIKFLPTPIFTAKLSHWHYDTFQLNWDGVSMLPSGKVQFILGPEGHITEMKIHVPNPDFDFTELEFKKFSE